MDLTAIMARFCQLSTLTPEEAAPWQPFCEEAAAQLAQRRNSRAPGTEGTALLSAAAAAMAYRRYVLASVAAGGNLRIGDTGVGPQGMTGAAAALEGEALAAAAPWLLPAAVFRRMGG